MGLETLEVRNGATLVRCRWNRNTDTVGRVAGFAIGIAARHLLVGLIGAETAARTAPPVANQQVVPEPATLVLMGTGVILVVVIRRWK